MKEENDQLALEWKIFHSSHLARPIVLLIQMIQIGQIPRIEGIRFKIKAA